MPHPRTSHCSYTPPRRPWPLLCLGALCFLLGACHRPLFTNEDARSQYDRNDAVRDQRAQSRLFDEYGKMRPNLRGRLLLSN